MNVGDRGVGKSSLIQTVVATIDFLGLKRPIYGPQSWPVFCRLAARRILHTLRLFHAKLVARRQELAQQLVGDVDAALAEERLQHRTASLESVPESVVAHFADEASGTKDKSNLCARLFPSVR